MDEVVFFYDTGELVIEFPQVDAEFSPEAVSFDGEFYTYTAAALLSDTLRASGESAHTY
jgi:hypothetical protein